MTYFVERTVFEAEAFASNTREAMIDNQLNDYLDDRHNHSQPRGLVSVQQTSENSKDKTLKVEFLLVWRNHKVEAYR